MNGVFRLHGDPSLDSVHSDASNVLYGFKPSVIADFAGNARSFWLNQREIQLNSSRRRQRVHVQRYKELNAKYQSESLQHRNDVNTKNETLRKYKALALDWKSKAQKLEKERVALQQQINDKERQLTRNRMESHNKISGKTKRRNSSLSTLSSLNSNISAFSGNGVNRRNQEQSVNPRRSRKRRRTSSTDTLRV